MSAYADMEVRKQKIVELTSQMLHKHYCENDVEAIIAWMDDDILWLGAAEHEWDIGLERVSGIFRQFTGRVPKCNISDEDYQVLEISPGAYLCTGRLWIETDPSTQISLRVHQRVTLAFRWVGEVPRCCHIHISNPYEDMTEEDIGFPSKIARQSYEYLQQQVEIQKQHMEQQTEILLHMSYEDSLTGLYNRNKFNEDIKEKYQGVHTQMGIACFDLNGLKKVNDRLGHSAGDALIQRAAYYLQQTFGGKTYRIGGDEFVVMDYGIEEQVFYDSVLLIQKNMEREGIHCSVGISWRDTQCSFREQFDEADQRMYRDKENFYNIHRNNRRN